MEVEAEVPWLFLSHSGAQKDLAWRLYHELLHVGHYPFFDQDTHHSLPIGLQFPPRIIRACRGCKMAVVILSHEYIESKWPMLELEQFTFHNRSALIYPLFYKLQPADLSDPGNLRRWQSSWESLATSQESRVQALQTSTPSLFNININSWIEALRNLKSRSGEIMGSGTMKHADVERIVSYICKEIPPPRRFSLGDHLKGGDRMQHRIDDVFQQPGCITNRFCGAIGVYGMGGSGKTTLCRNMANYYDKDFPGRSCLLELPTKNNETQFLEAIKKVLLALGQSSTEALERISTVDEAMSDLKKGLKRYKVFLAVDNVWNWAFESAKQIVSTEYVSGSKIMITSRSKRLLSMLIPTIVHVPSITEEEAIGALMTYIGASNFPHATLKEDMKSLVRSCFFGGQCHPLLLKAKGARLRQNAGHMNSVQDWKALITCRHDIHNDDEMEATVLSVLETSLLELPTKLQNIFLDLATCFPKDRSTSLQSCSEWLSMLHEGYSEEDMRYQLIRLEFYGVLEVENRWHSKYVYIHDLHKSLAASKVKLGPNDAHSRYLFEGQTSTLSAEECRQLKYIHTKSCYTDEEVLRLLKLCSGMEILILFSPLPLRLLSCTESMRTLRVLQLRQCNDLKEIKGWKWAPNLVSIELLECSQLENIGDIECLPKLEKLVVTPRLGVCTVPDLSKCEELKILVFSSKHLTKLASLGWPQNLQKLDLSRNGNLVDVGTIGRFTALQWLSLERCSKLQNFPIPNLSSLITLNLSWCINLESMEGSVSALTSLEDLNLRHCLKLKRVPDLSHLARLKVLQSKLRVLLDAAP